VTYDVADALASPMLREQRVETPQRLAIADITLAIRRIYQGGEFPIQLPGGIEKFTVHNIHEFAEKLYHQGLRATQA